MDHDQTLPFIDFGGEGETLHFAHANAYPPASYKQVIEPLKQTHRVIAFEQRPLWPDAPDPKSLRSWQTLVDDLIAFFDQQQLRNIIGVGHSMGSVVSFMAACKRPDLFRALVMMEPVAFSRSACFYNRLMPWVFKKRIPMMKKTLNRPDRWPDQQAAFDFHREKRAFARMSDDALWDYINAGVVAKENAWVLRYSKHWEARCYGAISYFRNRLLDSTLPVLAFRGGHNSTVPTDFWAQWQRNPNHQLIDMPEYGHLLPLEQPQEIGKHMMAFIQKHQ